MSKKYQEAKMEEIEATKNGLFGFGYRSIWFYQNR
jgi:hypothetical protein